MLVETEVEELTVRNGVHSTGTIKREVIERGKISNPGLIKNFIS